MKFIITIPTDLCKHLKELIGGMKLTRKLVAQRRNRDEWVRCGPNPPCLGGLGLMFLSTTQVTQELVKEITNKSCLFGGNSRPKMGERKERKQLFLMLTLDP